jgi:sigma-E factor negative regulatory protein RseB
MPGTISGGGKGAGKGNLANRQVVLNTALPRAATGPARSTIQWLVRLRQAMDVPAYTGTYVIWSAPGMLVSSRIWHASKGGVRIERVDALSGQPRSTYRVIDQRGSKIKTFLPAQHVLRIDRSDTPGKAGGFPNLPDVGQDMSPADYYDARQSGQQRVAGLMTDVVELVPRDGLRYGYRVWSEQRTGLPIKLQTLDTHGRVLEQAAFSSLTFDTPVNIVTLLRDMRHARGWRVERAWRVPTTMRAEGWQIGGPAQQPAPGFTLEHCYLQPTAVRVADVPSGKRSASAPVSSDSGPQDQSQTVGLRWFQCVFSDGLAAISVFINPYGRVRHGGVDDGEQDATFGATHLLARRVGNTGWVTVVGEVPRQTLRRFVASVSQLP